MTLYITAWNNHMSEEFHSSHYSAKSVLENVVVYESNEEREYVEDYYSYNPTIKDLEHDFEAKIEPTEDEIIDLKHQNSEYGRSSLLKINIARAITKRLNNIRGV